MTTAIPAEDIPHGDARRHRRGCRCDPCKAAVVRQNKHNIFLRQTGRGKMVTTTAAAKHLRSLRAAGMTDTQIQTAAKICPDQLYRVLRNAGKINRITEQRILAVSVPKHGKQVSHALTDGIGTRRRLQALIVAGWPGSEIADRLGIHKEQVSYMTRGCGSGKVTLKVEAAVRKVYLALWNQQPEAHGITPYAAQRARLRAERKGWAPAAAWDAIDDPNEVPRYGEQTESRTLAVIEDTAELALLGCTRDVIADRLGITWEAVLRAHRRAGAQVPRILTAA
ncbi:hypothetical protein [Kitasatospora cineracea]|uniref:hypothetical protein n=1 Tax=Kitasatospora cineracea TaxID=88074 RepID=UPI0036B9F424